MFGQRLFGLFILIINFIVIVNSTMIDNNKNLIIKKRDIGCTKQQSQRCQMLRCASPCCKNGQCQCSCH